MTEQRQRKKEVNSEQNIETTNGNVFNTTKKCKEKAREDKMVLTTS